MNDHRRQTARHFVSDYTHIRKTVDELDTALFIGICGAALVIAGYGLHANRLDAILGSVGWVAVYAVRGIRGCILEALASICPLSAGSNARLARQLTPETFAVLRRQLQGGRRATYGDLIATLVQRQSQLRFASMAEAVALCDAQESTQAE